MKITRTWAMPNSRTFSIKPIRELIQRYITEYKPKVIIDPYANGEKFATITNDLDPQYKTDYHLEAMSFLQILTNNFADMVLFDPPYSPSQVKQCYQKFDLTVDAQSTRTSYWSRQKTEIRRILKRGGYALASVGIVWVSAKRMALR